MSVYPDSYYAETMAAHPAHPRLERDTQADVCIIGGGLAGLTCALELANGGKKVFVLEARSVGWGASGRNGGLVSPGFAERLPNIVRKVGQASATELFALSREGAHYVRSNIDKYEMPGVDPVHGYFHVLRHDGGDELARLQDRLSSFGHDIEVWPTARVRDTLVTEKYFQAWFEPEAFHMHPLNYTLGLARAVTAAGGMVYENTKVREVRLDGAAKQALTAQGTVTADQIVFCTSAYFPGLYRPLARAVLPVSTYVVTTAPLGDPLHEVIRTRAGVVDNRLASDYYRIVDKDRLLWGGRISTRISRPTRLAERMRRDIVSVYPALHSVKIDKVWPGLMGYARHRMPIIGLMAPNVWAATAFGGHGLNTTAMGGRLIAAAILDGDDRYRLFAPFGPVWVGGPAGRIATQVIYWKMQAQDFWQERLVHRRSGLR